MTVDDTSKAGSSDQPGSLEPAFDVPANLAASTAIWLVRHGETEWSRSGQHTGRTDVALTPAGEDQARALRPEFEHLHPAFVLSSPRQRAIRTAELAGLQVDAVDPDLAEWDYGDYEGLTTPQIRAMGNPTWTVFADGVPNGETAEDVAVRVDRVLRRALEHVADGPVVFVAHGHISRVIAARWIGLAVHDGSHFTLGTAATSQLGAEHGSPVVAHLNLPNPIQPNPTQPESTQHAQETQ
jgi:broad specificity phosphatase PhoE